MTPKMVTTYISLKDSFAKAAGVKDTIADLERMAQENGSVSFQVLPLRCADAPLVISVTTYSEASAKKIVAEASRNAAVNRSWIQ